MTLQKWVVYIMGVYGQISHFLPDPTEILLLVIIKTLTYIMKVSVRKKQVHVIKSYRQKAFDKLI